jgi:hypothetical protein
MTFNSPRDPRLDPANPNGLDGRPSPLAGNWLPLVVAAAIAVAMVAMFYPKSAPVVGDTTNAGPSMVQPVTPTPSTAPAVAPTPVPSDPKVTPSP